MLSYMHVLATYTNNSNFATFVLFLVFCIILDYGSCPLVHIHSMLFQHFPEPVRTENNVLQK